VQRGIWDEVIRLERQTREDRTDESFYEYSMSAMSEEMEVAESLLGAGCVNELRC